MNIPGQNEALTEKIRIAEEIARKSSLDVMPPAPHMKMPSYPIPSSLKLAIELKENDRRQTEEAKCYSKILLDMDSFKNVNEDHYWFIMQLVLYLDHHQCNANMVQYSLYKQTLKRSKYNSNMVVLHVPGLQEGRPSVTVKDTVIIQQANGSNRTAGTVVAVGLNYLTTRVDYRFLEKVNAKHKFNIHFVYPDYSLNCKHFAVDRAMQFNLMPLLFPVDRPRLQYTLVQPPLLEWINPDIESNPEQQQAVLQILDKSAFPAPYILFGPPGTGKTSTLVEAIAQILKKDPSNRILVCTPCNAAADEVHLRLLKNDVDGYNIHRMYSSSRDGNTVNSILKPYSNIVKDSAIYIPKDILKTKKVVITTLITCHRLIAYDMGVSHFTYVFVDEAGQATEPETLIPMTLMSSSNEYHRGRLHGQLVIAGDPKQLGPMVTSRIAEQILGRSMLERLMDWDIYRKDENNKFNPLYVTKLVQNYRCHPAILHLPNELFYEGELKACGGSHTEKATHWNQLPASHFPIIFHAVVGNEKRERTSPSVFNPTEVAAIVTYVKDLLKAKFGGRQVLQTDIGIITPYKLQRQKITAELRKHKWTDINVGTVESFQGQERDIIIVSTVRSGIYRHNDHIHIGFLSNPKRFNVALTRARALLIVIGNPVILSLDDCWEKFVSYCVVNGACRGSKFNLNMNLDDEAIQRLMAPKHVRRNDYDPNAPYEINEKPPTKPKTYQLPEIDPTRRRRLPNVPPLTKVSNESGKTKPDQSYRTNYSSETSLDGSCFDLWTEVLNPDDASSSNSVNPKGDYELQTYYSCESLQAQMTPPDDYTPLKHPENSLEDESSTTTTDQSDKSSDSNEDIDENPAESIETTSTVEMREEMIKSLTGLSL